MTNKKIYKELGLEPKPFKNVTYYYPYNNIRPENVLTNAKTEDVKKQCLEGRAYAYKCPLENSIDKLDLLLANEDDSTGTMESCVNFIMNRQGEFKNVNSWSTLKEIVKKYSEATSSSSNPKMEKVFTNTK